MDDSAGPTLGDLEATLPFWIRWPVDVAVVIGALAAVHTIAYDGRVRMAPVIAIGGVLTLGDAWRQRRWWRLDAAQRRAIRSVMRTGGPSGDARIDDLASARLRELAVRDRPGLAKAVAGIALFAVVPALATVRTGTLWWALLALPMACAARRFFLPLSFDPNRNLALLEDRSARARRPGP